MSGKDDMKWKDSVDIKLIGPDGKIKDARSTRKINPIALLFALVLFIPYSIYRVFFKQLK